MTPDRWQKVEQIFHEALDKPASERPAWLASACDGDAALESEVQSLLESDRFESTVGLNLPVQQAVVALHASAAPRMAGPYELLDRIGHGGMGTVYRARRADEQYQTTVAIKLVRPGMDTDFILARFRRERQILAKLSHPNIARLLDGGTTEDDVPYIVMEFIEGVWITDYCRNNALSIRQKLQLFQQVCSAVDYAHRNFVVHRDIKPGNILVDKTGTPKLLDFGICKLIHSNPMETQEALTRGIGLMTPDYASPEQVLGDTISPRSDVYSLGAVLYELLTGKRAHQIDKYTPLAVEEAICRTDTMLPSAAISAEPVISRELEGDLDNIVLRAMQKDPDRRYESAAAFAQDIEHYLNDMPVLARPDTRFYRSRKFVKRHRAMVAAVTSIVLALGIGFGVAVRQAQRAGKREQETRAIARSLLFEVYDSMENLAGATKARQTIVQTGTRYLDALGGTNPTEPELLRELSEGYSRLAEVQGNNNRSSNLGNSAQALASYRKALRYGEQYLAARPDDRAARANQAELLRHTADVEVITEGPRKGVETYRQALAEVRKLLAVEPKTATRELAADILLALGRQEREIGEVSLSLERASEALSIFEAIAAAEPVPVKLVSVAAAASALGMAEARADRLNEALSHYRRAIEIGEKLVAQQPERVNYRRNVMIAYSHVGDVLANPTMPNLGNPAMGKEAYGKTVAHARHLHSADPTDARARLDLSIALTRYAGGMANTDPDKAPSLREAISLLKQARALAPNDLSIRGYLVSAHSNLGSLLRTTGDLEGAARELAVAAEAGTPLLEKGSEGFRSAYLDALGKQALTALDRGRRNEAIEMAQHLVAEAEKAAARPGDPKAVGIRAVKPKAYGVMARVQSALGNKPQSAEWREKALAGWSELESKAGFLAAFKNEKQAMENLQ